MLLLHIRTCVCVCVRLHLPQLWWLKEMTEYRCYFQSLKQLFAQGPMKTGQYGLKQSWR